MQTVTDILRRKGEDLLDGIAILLGTDRLLRDVNAPTNGFLIIGPHYEFEELSEEKKHLQSWLRQQHDHYMALVRAILRIHSKSTQRSIDQWDETLREIIDQDKLVWYKTTGEAKAAAKQTIDEILDEVAALHDPVEGSVILVPDTNALIYSPAFQSWQFDGIDKFEILLVPTVLSELDSLKIEHRNSDVRQKAQEVIRQIKEYRRRGYLHDGVAVIANRIRLRAIAVEPQVEQVLPWLDSNSPDDRILASIIEVMRAHPRSVVLLVSGDINLQNKAEFACVPFVEPPIVR